MSIICTEGVPFSVPYWMQDYGSRLLRCLVHSLDLASLWCGAWSRYIWCLPPNTSSDVIYCVSASIPLSGNCFEGFISVTFFRTAPGHWWASEMTSWAVDGQLWEHVSPGQPLAIIRTNWEVLNSTLGQHCPTELSVIMEMFWSVLSRLVAFSQNCWVLEMWLL